MTSPHDIRPGELWALDFGGAAPELWLGCGAGDEDYGAARLCAIDEDSEDGWPGDEAWVDGARLSKLGVGERIAASLSPAAQLAVLLEGEDDLNLDGAYRRLVEAALERAGSPAGAAPLLGVPTAEVCDLMTRLRVEWPPAGA